jgi:hypothetical protein
VGAGLHRSALGLNVGVCVPLLIVFLTIAQAEEGVGDVDPL